jgi:hypothetical protein
MPPVRGKRVSGGTKATSARRGETLRTKRLGEIVGDAFIEATNGGCDQPPNGSQTDRNVATGRAFAVLDDHRGQALTVRLTDPLVGQVKGDECVVAVHWGIS